MSTDTAQADVAQTSATVEDRLNAFFSGSEPEATSSPEAQSEPPEAEAQAEDSQDAEITDEVSPEDIPDDDEEQPAQTSDEVELTWKDETVKVTKDEAKNLAQLGYHLQKAREQVTGELEQAQTSARQIAQAVQNIQQAAPQLQALQTQMQAMHMLANAKGLTPQHLLEVSRTDPARAVEMRAELDELSAQYNQLTRQYQQTQQQFEDHQKELKRQSEAAEFHRLMQLNPNLKDPVQMNKAREMLQTEFGKWRPESVKTATDNAEILDLLIDGAKYRRLQSTKRDKLATAGKAPQVVKPGTATQQTTQRVQEVKSLRAQLKKSGRVEDAARIFMRMK